MKRLILTAAVVLLAAFPVLAGLQTDTILNGGTNTVAAASTNSLRNGGAWYFGKSTDITLEVNAALTGSGTPNTLVTFDASINKDQWVTNAVTLALPQSGTSRQCIMTNLAGGKYPYFRRGEVWNTNATLVITNLQVRAFDKTGE